MQRLCGKFPHFVWLNPVESAHWHHTPSIRITREIIGDRMFPLTLRGLDEAMATLKRRGASQDHFPGPQA